MNIRRIIGIGAILLGLIGWFALKQETSPGEYVYSYPVLLDAIVYIWLVFSYGTKIMMIFQKQWKILNILSVIWFFVLIVIVEITIEKIAPYQRPFVYEFLAGLFLVGWVLIDAIDLFYLRNRARSQRV